MLSPSHLRELFDGLHNTLSLEKTHISMEANPATFGKQKAQLFRELGVNRCSLGIQSFNASVLKTLGREHTPSQAEQAVQILQAVGMEEINIDLMFSIPGLTHDMWQHTLETAVSLKPDHISAYNLTYEEDTAFLERLTAGDYQENEDINAEQFQLAHKKLTESGFHHYETSNYAQPGMESRHNQSYWLGDDYLGIGPSAVSTINGKRWKNLPDTAKYIHAINTVGHAKQEEEIINDDAFRIERIALLLRTSKGLPQCYLEDTPNEIIDNLLDNNLAEINDEYLRLIGNGTMLVDSIAEQLV